MQGSVTYTTQPTPLTWSYLLPMLLWGAVVLFSALQFIALCRVGSILRRILFRMEHPTAVAHPVIQAPSEVKGD